MKLWGQKAWDNISWQQRGLQNLLEYISINKGVKCFIPNCLQVLLFSLSSLELEKHANTESASNRNTRRAPALTQAACSGRQRMHDPCLSHLCTTLLAHVFMCMHLSRHFCCFFLNSDHLDFSLMYSCLYTWVMTRLCAAEIALPWGYWVCFWEGDFRMRLKGLYYVEYA